MASRLLVVGGSGYLGRHVVRAGLAQGLAVSSFSRSGAPLSAAADQSLAGVEWLSGNAESEADVAKAVDGKTAVVSCLGTPFGTPESILKLNGAANVSFTAAAASAGVERYVYVSAATFALMERLFPDSWGKYFEGKRQAEAAVAEHFGARGTILKPGVIYTSDLAEAKAQMALGLKEAKMPSVVGAPLASIFASSPVQKAAASMGSVGQLLTPPSRVDEVAAAAIAHVLHDKAAG